MKYFSVKSVGNILLSGSSFYTKKDINSKSLFIFILIIFFIMLPSSVLAEGILAKYKRCVAEKRADLEKPQKKKAYRDRGCRTSSTNRLTGARDSCRANICWDAPPHHLIVEANIWSHSAAGSEHSFGSTDYLPSREFSTKFCTPVHARSPSGRTSGRGWQKLSADVTLKRQITPAETAKIESECEREVLGQ